MLFNCKKYQIFKIVPTNNHLRSFNIRYTCCEFVTHARNREMGVKNFGVKAHLDPVKLYTENSHVVLNHDKHWRLYRMKHGGVLHDSLSDKNMTDKEGSS